MSSPFLNDKHCRYMYLNNSPSISFLTEDVLPFSKIRVATAVVFSKKVGHLQLGKRLKEYYSNTNSDSACCFEKGGKSSVRKEIAGLLFKYD